MNNSLFPEFESVKASSKTRDWKGNTQANKVNLGVKTNWVRDKSQKFDFYATDPKAGVMLLELDTFSDVWECAAGAGHLAEVFDRAGILTRHSDIHDYGIGSEILNFLEYNGEWDGDIITNPPYKFSTEFAFKALELLKDGRKLALFLPQRYLSSIQRRKLFENFPPYKVWASTARIECGKNGVFKNTSSVDYCWFVWHKGYIGETKLGWFN
jgi:hypothetical protein